MNYKLGPVTFNNGDIVEMEMDTATMTLHIHCKGLKSHLKIIPP
jgi:hypothetical protein